MEHHLEARLWNDVFTFTRRTRSALAARHDPRDGADRDAARRRSRWTRSSTSCASTPTGLNAGRWDYIFSMIKCFRDRPGVRAARPQRREDDRAVHARLHGAAGARPATRRGAFAMGGMAALIPSRKDAEANERAIDGRAGGQGARGRGRLRRHLGRAPRRRRRRARRRSTRCSATSPTRSTSQRDDVDVDAPSSCSTPPPRPARSPRRACATTSTSASSTSRSGSAAAARRGSTT